MQIDFTLKLTQEEKQAITTTINTLKKMSDGEVGIVDEYLYDMQVPYVQELINGLEEIRGVAEDE